MKELGKDQRSLTPSIENCRKKWSASAYLSVAKRIMMHNFLNKI